MNKFKVCSQLKWLVLVFIVVTNTKIIFSVKSLNGTTINIQLGFTMRILDQISDIEQLNPLSLVACLEPGSLNGIRNKMVSKCIIEWTIFRDIATTDKSFV